MVADTLSRPPQPVAAIGPPVNTSPLDWAAISRDQGDDRQLAELRSDTGLQLTEVEMHGSKVWCDTSTGLIRPVIPVGHREKAVAHVHGLAHAGTRATTRMLSQRYVWPGLASDTKTWCRQCEKCNRAKVFQHAQADVEKIPVPEHRFSHIHVDLVGPLPPDPSGHSYLLTIIDRSTRWFEAAPLERITAEHVLDVFVATWIARFGVPARITTDRGTQFTSSTWTSYCARIGAQHITTTAFHPQANGMVERLHRQLKDALRARAGQWWEELPYAVLGLRAAPKDESGISAAEAALGQKLVLPGQAMPTETVPPAGPPPPNIIPAASRDFPTAKEATKRLEEADWVYIRKDTQTGGPLANNYEGPYKVLARRRKTFRVQLGDRVDSISVDRLKPHLGVGEPTAAQPPRRGRPPRSATGR